jgi:hypothetical protein
VLRRIVTLVACAALGLSLCVLTTSPAVAGQRCVKVNPVNGHCEIWVSIPDPPPGNPTDPNDPPPSGGGHVCYWDPAQQGLSRPPAGLVPCTSGDGYWSNLRMCYIQLADPQPLAGDPAWEGHASGEGAVYGCYQPQTDMFVYIWSQNPPPGAGSGPTPGDVAENAIASMDLRGIDIGIVPKPGPKSVGLVGMPTWMWVDNPDRGTFGPYTITASAGGITVTATAEVDKIVWDMGDGSKVTCTTAGTPYEARFEKEDSPDCGHTYTGTSASQPHGVYTVTADSYWVVNWAGAGQSGTLRLAPLTQATHIRMGELQVLVQ